MTFPKKERIKKTKDLQTIFRSGKSSTTEYVSAKIVFTGSERKVSVIVPVKIAPKAVMRNLLRRKVSGALKGLIPDTRPGYQLVITVRKSPLPPSKSLIAEILLLLDKSGILNR